MGKKSLYFSDFFLHLLLLKFCRIAAGRQKLFVAILVDDYLFIGLVTGFQFDPRLNFRLGFVKNYSPDYLEINFKRMFQ